MDPSLACIWVGSVDTRGAGLDWSERATRLTSGRLVPRVLV